MQGYSVTQAIRYAWLVVNSPTVQTHNTAACHSYQERRRHAPD